MTSSKTTKRALFSSALAMVVCVAMLIGTTFAWFTDTASSKSNKIQAGKLDVKLLMHDGNNYVDISENNDPIFGSGATANSNNASTLWEPGKTQVAYLAIENAGNLDLKYSVKLNVSNATKHLYEVMQYAITPDAVPSTPIAGWTTGTDVVEGAQDTEAVDITLAKGATHYFALSIHMKESAGNAYQGGTVDFDITVLATQVNSESDSFGTDYDATAAYPAYSVATKVPTTGGELNLETNETNSIKATVPSEVVAGKTSVSLKHDGVVGNRTNNTITINALELVDENGNVIDLSGNTTKKLTITLPVSFSDGTLVTVAHDGEEVTTTLVSGGKVTYETYHLCDVTLKAVENVVNVSADATEIENAIAKAANDGKSTITLMVADTTTEKTVIVNSGTIQKIKNTTVYLGENVVLGFAEDDGRERCFVQDGHTLKITGKGTIQETDNLGACGGATLIIENEGGFVRTNTGSVMLYIAEHGANVTIKDYTVYNKNGRNPLIMVGGGVLSDNGKAEDSRLTLENVKMENFIYGANGTIPGGIGIQVWKGAVKILTKNVTFNGSTRLNVEKNARGSSDDAFITIASDNSPVVTFNGESK